MMDLGGERQGQPQGGPSVSLRRPQPLRFASIWGAQRRHSRQQQVYKVVPTLEEDLDIDALVFGRGKPKQRPHAVLGLLAAIGGSAAGFASGTLWSSVALALCYMEPFSAKVVGLGSLWSRARFLGLNLPGGGRFGLSLLQPLRAPMLAIGAARSLMPTLMPSMWRNVCYWRRIMPIFARYLWTKRRAAGLRRKGREEEAEDLWQERHCEGAEEIYRMLVDLRGFYLKLGQIIAAKTDMLGPVYTKSLGRLHDQMPHAPLKEVRQIIRRELKTPSSKLFQWIDDIPLASATIAQVHSARLVDGREVVVKVQHKGVERMMRSDLRNMRLFMEILKACRIELGFDLLSIIREYQEVVPFEFDFIREGSMQALTKMHLAEAGYDPVLVVPEVEQELSTKRMLVMEHLSGVPILDIQQMAELDKVEVMTKLIRSFGLMILRDGVFHTDPHPGNLLALHNHAVSRTAVGLLDFGQVKELSAESQEDYAKLVLAMAARDPNQVRDVMVEVGLDIRGCSEEFRALAGYILFDTRMDFDEAWMSPFEAAAHEFRATVVKVFPQELFMIMRVVTLIRGILGSLEVDVSSALLWKDLAEDVLAGRAGIRAHQNAQQASTAAGVVPIPMGQTVRSSLERLKLMAGSAARGLEVQFPVEAVAVTSPRQPEEAPAPGHKGGVSDSAMALPPSGPATPVKVYAVANSQLSAAAAAAAAEAMDKPVFRSTKSAACSPVKGADNSSFVSDDDFNSSLLDAGISPILSPEKTHRSQVSTAAVEAVSCIPTAITRVGSDRELSNSRYDVDLSVSGSSLDEGLGGVPDVEGNSDGLPPLQTVSGEPDIHLEKRGSRPRLDGLDRSSLENMRQLLAASHKSRGSKPGPIMGKTLDGMLAMPNLRSIKTTPANVNTEEVLDSADDQYSFGMNIRPFAPAAQPDGGEGSTPAAKEALKTHQPDSAAFTFSQAARPSHDRTSALHTWADSGKGTDRSETRDDMAVRGALPRLSRLGDPCDSPGLRQSSNIIHKQMNAGAGAPRMQFKVKLSDV